MNARLPDSVGAEVARLLAALPIIRPLRADDRELVDALVRELSPTSRYRRFHAPVNELSPALLDRLARVDVPDEVALLATTTARGCETAVGEARYAVAADRHDAREFALVVIEPWQRLGVGTQLLRELMWQAEKSGVMHLYGDTFADNTPMLALARRLGFVRRRHPVDARLVRLSWTPDNSIDRVVASERRRTPGPLLT
jgi:acetyltransferase